MLAGGFLAGERVQVAVVVETQVEPDVRGSARPRRNVLDDEAADILVGDFTAGRAIDVYLDAWLIVLDRGDDEAFLGGGAFLEDWIEFTVCQAYTDLGHCFFRSGKILEKETTFIVSDNTSGKSIVSSIVSVASKIPLFSGHRDEAFRLGSVLSACPCAEQLHRAETGADERFPQLRSRIEALDPGTVCAP